MSKSGQYKIAAVAAIAFFTPAASAARSVWHDKPVAIAGGDYLMDSITSSTQHFAAHTRISVNPKAAAEWGMCWGDPEGDYTAARFIFPAFRQHNDSYRDMEAVLQIERCADGNTRIVSRTPLGDIADTEGRANSIKLFYEKGDDNMHVYAGNEMQHPVAKSEANAPCRVWYFTCQPSGLNGCGALALDGRGGSIAQSEKFQDADSLMAYLKGSRDGYEGVWRYLDRNMNEKYASMGGRYTIATVANEAGGYDILYLDGADSNDMRWRPLCVKGTLAPTIFKGNYDMKWIDAEGMEYSDDTNAQYADDGSMLTLSFPALSTQLRFSRLILR